MSERGFAGFSDYRDVSVNAIPLETSGQKDGFESMSSLTWSRILPTIWEFRSRRAVWAASAIQVMLLSFRNLDFPQLHDEEAGANRTSIYLRTPPHSLAYIAIVNESDDSRAALAAYNIIAAPLISELITTTNTFLDDQRLHLRLPQLESNIK